MSNIVTTLTEELLLLAMEDDKGRTVAACRDTIGHGLAGAVLLEMVLREELVYEGDTWTFTTDTFDEEEHTEAFHTIDQKDTRFINTWLLKLESKSSKIKDALIESLVRKGVLEIKKKKVLGLFPVTIYPELNGDPEEKLREEIHEVVINEKEGDVRVNLVIQLFGMCDLIKEVFRDETENQRIAGRRITEIAQTCEYPSSIQVLINEISGVIANVRRLQEMRL